MRLRRAIATVASSMSLAFGLARCVAFTPEPVETAQTDGGGPLEATSDAARPRFCASLVTSSPPPAVCADFDEPDPRQAWREGKLESLWVVERNPSALDAAPSDLSPPSLLQATSRRPADEAGITEGLYAVTLEAKSRFRIALDLRYANVVADTEVALPVMVTLGPRRVDFRLSAVGGRVEFTRSGTVPVTRTLAPGMPLLRGNWRNLVIEISSEPSPDGSLATRFRAKMGEYLLVDELAVPTGKSSGANADHLPALPASLKLQIGLNDAKDSTVIQFENVVISSE